MPRIALLTASLRGGGAERVQLTLGAEFARRGYTVDLVVFEDDGPLRNTVPETVNTVCLNVHRVMRGILPLSRYLKTKQPDVVIAAMTHVEEPAALAFGCPKEDFLDVVGSGNDNSLWAPFQHVSEQVIPLLVQMLHDNVTGVL